MNKEEFINSKMKLSKEDIIYNYHEVEEKLIEKLGIEHENYNLQKENKILKENAENNDKVIDKVNWENQLLKKENKQLKERIGYLERSNNRREDTILEQRQNLSDLEDKWNKIKEYFNERIEVCDNRLSSPFCNFEKATKERLIFTQCLEKLEELEGNDNND